MQVRQRAKRNLLRWRRWLESYLERPWYVPAVAVVSAVNAFIPFFPIELFLILRVLVRPKEWWRVTLIAVAASVVGIVCLARLVEHQPHADLLTWLGNHLGKESWENATGFIHRHGSFGLGLLSVTFLPLPPAVIVCALSKVPKWQIALSIASGHSLKYGFFAWMAAYFPRRFQDE